MQEIILKILAKYGKGIVLLTSIFGSFAIVCYFAYTFYFWSAERTGSPLTTIAAAAIVAVVAVFLNIICGFVGSGEFDFRWIRYPASLAACGAIIGAIGGQYPTIVGWFAALFVGSMVTFYTIRRHFNKGQR